MYGKSLSSQELKDKLQTETAGMLRRELPQVWRNNLHVCTVHQQYQSTFYYSN